MKKDTRSSKIQKNFVHLRLINNEKQNTSNRGIVNSTHLSTAPSGSSQNQEKSQITSDAFIILRLNDFDVLEETFGHSVTTELAGLVKCRLQSCLRSEDDLEQINTNEFAIMVIDVPSKAYIKKLFKRIEDQCNGEYVCSSLNFHTTVTSGVSIAPQYSTHYEEQLRFARIALRQTEKKPNASLQFFSPEMLDNLQKRAGMIIQLRQALKKDRFVLHYQPQFSVETQKTVSVEALLRMYDQDGELVYPNRFIDLAEESGLILPIGHWVIQKACMQFRSWLDIGCAPRHIAVNVSAKQLADTSLIKIVDTAVIEAGIDYNNLELEITEQSLIKKLTLAESVLNRLSEKGVRIALDDFGTGYSSLAYLDQLPLNVLKIDRSFLQQLENNNRRSAGLIRSIIYIAKELDMEVVAEGVENLTQQQFIKSVGCHFGQGYAYSKPKDVNIITSLLQPKVMKA